MKKLLLSVSLMVSIFNANLFAKENKIHYLSKKETIELLKTLPNSEKLINQYEHNKINIYVEPKEDFYIVMIKGERRGQFFITKDKRYAIFGSILDLKKKKNIIGDFPINKDLIKKGVAFTYGSGNKDIYLVTDPQCPYCRMLENKKGDMLLKKYRIHVILYPLPFHQYAKPMTEYILAGKNDIERAARMRRVLKGSNEWKNFHPSNKEKKEIQEKMTEMQKAVNELGAQGTPTIYDSNFKQIPLERIYNEK